MSEQTHKEGHEPTPRRLRDSQAVLIFLGGILLLFVFFAGGAFIGRWSRLSDRAVPAAQPQPASSPQRASTEFFLVEVEVTDSREQADAMVSQLRRQYTSATAEKVATDQRYHVYVGPYGEEAANTVAAELAQQGIPSVTVTPYRR